MTPFVVVKADAGTYGMGVMTVRDADRGDRAEPQAAQQDERGEGRPGSQFEVMIQEGVPIPSRRLNAALPSRSST
jgi:glutamate--cysteine ligase